MPGPDESDCSYENLAIDNSSTDGSAYVLNCIEGIQVIRFEQSRGSGFARSVGSRAARDRFVVWTDADMTYSNEENPNARDDWR